MYVVAKCEQMLLLLIHVASKKHKMSSVINVILKVEISATCILILYNLLFELDFDNELCTKNYDGTTLILTYIINYCNKRIHN